MTEQDTSRQFVRRVGIVVAMVTGVFLVLQGIWAVIDVLLLVFAGMLLAIFLHALADWLHDHTPLRYGIAYGIVLITGVALTAIGVWAIAPTINQQVMQLEETLPQAIERLQETVSTWPGGQQLIEQTPQPEELLARQSIFGRMSGIFSVTFGVLANIVIVLFVGLYGAYDPKLYREGLVRLVPISKRPRAEYILTHVASALRQWLLGQLTAMLIIGVTTTVTLWFLGIPLAFLLGIIAALLTFIPNIGPILSAVPAILLGLVESPTKALYVILAYVIIQTIESYFITPLIQRRMVELPPAVTIVSQVALGVLFGVVGLLVATPLAVAVIVLVQMIYVNGVLNDDMPVYGE